MKLYQSTQLIERINHAARQYVQESVSGVHGSVSARSVRAAEARAREAMLIGAMQVLESQQETE